MFLFIHWSIHPDIPLPFHFFTVQWYGLMWTLSIFGCFFLGKWILEKEHLTEEHLVLLIQYIFLGAIIGARLGQVIFYNPTYFLAHPVDIVQVWKGGLASHGGVVGGLMAIYFFHRAHPQYGLLWLFDRVALIIYLPCSLIRLGNLFNSELVGKATDVCWAFIFDRVDTVPRHPVVLYESICYALLLLLVLTIYRSTASMRVGFYASFFFIATFSVRFLLEFMKEPEGDLIFNCMSKTQLLSVPMIVLGLVFFLKKDWLTKNPNA